MILRYWAKTEDVLMGIFAMMALALICFEVVVRYFYPAMLPDWGSEFVIYFVVWAIFLGGSSLVEEGRHVRADIIVRMFSHQTQRILEIISCLTGILFCGVVFWFAIDVVNFAYEMDERSESSILFPLFIYYLGMPVGFGLMVIRYLMRLYRYLFHFDAATMVISDDDILRDK